MNSLKSTECAVCFGIFTNPHNLRCSHTFCKSCIDCLKTGRKIRCPLCKSCSDEKKIKPNYSLIDVLQDIKHIEERHKKEIQILKDALQDTKQIKERDKEEIQILKHVLQDMKQIEERHKKEIQILKDIAFNASSEDYVATKTTSALADLPKPCGEPSLAERHWTLRKTVKLKQSPKALRFIDGQLWQCHCEGITVLTIDLELAKKFRSGDMGSIFDVAVSDRGEVIAAAEKGLYILNNDDLSSCWKKRSLYRSASSRSRIAEGWFSSLCLHGDELFASDRDSSTVHVFKLCDITWAQHHSFKVLEGWATLGAYNAKVIMCIHQQHKIFTYSLSGELLSSAGSEGRDIGEMNSPRLCTVDSVGTSLIADYNNRRLQLLSRSGTWSLIHLQPRVGWPKGALVNNDRLYVNSLDLNSSCYYLHMYDQGQYI